MLIADKCIEKENSLCSFQFSRRKKEVNGVSFQEKNVAMDKLVIPEYSLCQNAGYLCLHLYMHNNLSIV